MYAELVCKVGRKHGSMSRGDLKFCTILIFLVLVLRVTICKPTLIYHLLMLWIFKVSNSGSSELCDCKMQCQLCSTLFWLIAAVVKGLLPTDPQCSVPQEVLRSLPAQEISCGPTDIPLGFYHSHTFVLANICS